MRCFSAARVEARHKASALDISRSRLPFLSMFSHLIISPTVSTILYYLPLGVREKETLIILEESTLWVNIIGRTNIGQGRGKSSRSVKDVCGT